MYLYGSNSIVSPLICRCGNLILKLHQKKVATTINNGFLSADLKLEVYQR